jgi:hypothetical protein
VEASRSELIPFPVYNSNRVPTDFFVFGYIKGKLSDYDRESQENILSAITEFLTGVDQGVLLSVCESWVNRLKWAIKHERKDSTQYKKPKDAS